MCLAPEISWTGFLEAIQAMILWLTFKYFRDRKNGRIDMVYNIFRRTGSDLKMFDEAERSSLDPCSRLRLAGGS